MIKLKTLRWGDYLGLSGGIDVIVRVLIRERRRQASQRLRHDGRSRCQGDAVAGWKGATSHGMQAATRSWKQKKKQVLPGGPPEGTQSC